MSRTGRAVVYDAPNTPFEVREYPVRDARPGEVLVRITMSTICRSDIHSYQGHRPNPCPGILGHEIIGIIEQIGAGIDKDLRGDTLAVGDRVQGDATLAQQGRAALLAIEEHQGVTHRAAGLGDGVEEAELAAAVGDQVFHQEDARARLESTLDA